MGNFSRSLGEKVKEDQKHTSSICDYRIRIQCDVARPKLQELIDLQVRVENLTFIPDEWNFSSPDHR